MVSNSMNKNIDKSLPKFQETVIDISWGFFVLRHMFLG